MANEWLALKAAVVEQQVAVLGRKLWEEHEALYEELILAGKLGEYLEAHHAAQFELAIENARVADVAAWKANQAKQVELVAVAA